MATWIVMLGLFRGTIGFLPIFWCRVLSVHLLDVL